MPSVAVSACVIVLVLGLRRVSRRIPGALVAVVAAIAAGRALDLPRRGVAVLGPVPGGLPLPSLPGVSLADARALLPIAAAMCVVILAQSAATSRAYAARYNEQVDTDSDLVGLAGANVGAALTGSFVVNGSPTKTQMVDEAGGRSQLAQLAAAATVLVVVAALTGLLDTLPLAALASVVFLIGVDLMDVAGMRRIYAVRRTEFVVAALTALTVVLLGVQTGIVAGRGARSSTTCGTATPRTASWSNRRRATGIRCRWRPGPYRRRPARLPLRHGLYFANAARFAADLATITRPGPPAWFCLDGAAIGDVDYSAAAVLAQCADAATGAVCASSWRTSSSRWPSHSTATASPRARPRRLFDTSGEVLEAYQKATACSG